MPFARIGHGRKQQQHEKNVVKFSSDLLKSLHRMPQMSGLTFHSNLSDATEFKNGDPQ
jgi:hypothetical protein